MAGPRNSLHSVPAQTFAGLLKQSRLGADLTQAELAERLGVTQQRVGAWERGDRPQARLMGELARFVGLSSEAELLSLLDADAPIPQRSAGTQQQDWADLTDGQVVKRLAQFYVETRADAKLLQGFLDYFQGRQDR